MLYQITGEVEIFVSPEDGPLIEGFAKRIAVPDDATRADVLARALETVVTPHEVVGWWDEAAVVAEPVTPRQVMAESGAAMLFEDLA